MSLGKKAESTARQLRCVTVKSVKVKKKRIRNKRASSKPEPPEIGIQLDLFSSFDGDDEELAS